MTGVSLIIPALNEAEAIGACVRSIPREFIDEILVVDNGSTDATAAEATLAGARVVTSPRGYGAACAAGVAAALPSSNILVFMDGDGADDAADLSKLLTPIQRGEQDFVLTSRLMGTREPGSMLPSQVFAGHLIGVLLRPIVGVRYTDMCAFRAIRRDALAALGMSEMTFGWNLEMQVRAAQHKLRILEIPTNYRNRSGGVSKVSGNISATLKTASRILQVLGRALKPAPGRTDR